MTKIFRTLAVLAAVFCMVACGGPKGEARYEFAESDLLVWEHAQNPSGEDVIIITLLPESAERFNAFTQEHMGKVIDIYQGKTLLSSPKIREVSKSNMMYLAGFKGRDFERLKSGLPPAKQKTE